MKRFLLIAVFLLLPCAAQAQTHYCDTPQPTTATAVVGSTLTISHCNDGRDATGTAPVSPTSFKLYDNGTGAVITMMSGTTSTVSGKTVYTGNYIVPATVGAHAIQTTALVGVAESAKSNTFTVTAVAAIPSAPTNLSGK